MPRDELGGDTLHSTLELVETHGWRIFPTILIPRPDGRIDKRPAIRNWPNECSRDPVVIRSWWRQWPNAVPSLVTGPRNGIVVIDVDVGVDPQTGLAYSGWDSLETAFHCHSAPPTPHVITRRGGSHLYFQCDKLPDSDILDDRHPAHKAAIKNSVSILAPHVDVRGWNGQVVLPAQGTGYTVDPALPFSIPMLKAQPWFNHREPRKFKRSEQHGRFDPELVLIDACNEIRHAPQGTRHNAYRWAVFRVARLVGMGLIPRDHAHAAMMGEVMALGMVADGSTGRVEKYFHASWEEGLAAGKGQRR